MRYRWLAINPQEQEAIIDDDFIARYGKINPNEQGYRKLAWVEWLPANNNANNIPKDISELTSKFLAQYPTIIMAHGLTRRGFDFMTIANSMAKEGYWVIAPDIAGRGESDWLAKAQEYNYHTYVQDMSLLIESLELKNINWLGTSMGGIIGMMLAVLQPAKISRLILNDIGSLIPGKAISYIADYVKNAPEYFLTIQEMESYLRQIYQPFGIISNKDWQFFAQISSRKLQNGQLRFHYDPAIIHIIEQSIPEDKTKTPDVNLKALWAAINCPVLVIRGEHSDLLPASIFTKMIAEKSPFAEGLVCANAGHAPALIEPTQISAISDWLARKIPTPPPAGWLINLRRKIVLKNFGQ